MKAKALTAVLAIGVLALVLSACGGEQAVDVKKLMAQPKAYVGSDTCKMCHLEHFDSWMMTLHSRMTQDPQKNKDVIIADFDEKRIRADLAKLGDKLKVPADQIFIPKVEDIKYTIGSQWKQRYIIEKNGILYIAPIQYFADTDRWVNYNEATWEKNPWLLKCGGCHATGVDIDKQKFIEPGVSCEACHGKGSWHAALPKTAVFEKRQTIVNPSKLTSGVAMEICGSCHNRGKATKYKDAEWAVGYEPGKALEIFFKSTSFAGGDANSPLRQRVLQGSSPAIHRLEAVQALQGRCELRFMPLRAPDRGAAYPLTNSGSGFQAVFSVPYPSQPEHGPLDSFFCQLRGLPYAADSNQRRVRRPAQPCVYHPAAVGDAQEQGYAQLLPNLPQAQE